MTGYRPAARLRLTLAFAATALVCGLVLLAVLHAVVADGVRTTAPPVVVAGAAAGDPAAMAEEKRRSSIAVEAARARLEASTVEPVLLVGLLSVAALTALAAAAGWAVAGRTLRPISTIATTARRVADRSLHERIALSGRRDEWRELADTFDGMLSRLDAAFEGQRRFVGNASHELKTPLAVNRTLLEVAMERPDCPPELRSLGETLLEVNARHENLVDGLLTLARADHGLRDTVPVDLAAVAAAVVDLAGVEARRLGVDLALDAEPVPEVEGDPLLLERMVQNLVRNGVRHNARGGWVRVRVGPAGGGASVRVENTGPAVAEAAVPSLFQPFQRAAGRIASGQGTGLGLSIVDSVVRVHGGSLEAVPRPEGGMAVSVTVPPGR